MTSRPARPPLAFTRRNVMALLACTPLLGLAARPAYATQPQVDDEIKRLYAGRPVTPGKIKLDLPPLAENGNVVPLRFEVESPMTAENYVKSFTIFAAENPNPVVASYHFTPLIPRAAGQMRIRLAKTQSVLAIAEMSDGSLFSATQEVKVTIGGCGG